MDVRGSELLERIVKAPSIALILDFDGTLIPFVDVPAEARVDDPTRELLEALAHHPGISVAIVSGRKRDEIERMLGGIPDLLLVAEHGSWRRDGRGWTQLALHGADPTPIERTLRGLARANAGALVERKSWSVTLHYRRVPSARREALVVEASDAIETWTREHPEYELMEGAQVLEVRHRGGHKGTAVEWLRARCPSGTCFVALGDDRTDEDTFAALGPDDIAVLVGDAKRPTRAKARLDDTTSVRLFLRTLLHSRAAEEPSGEFAFPRPLTRSQRTDGVPFLVISNRLPDAPSGAAGESERARNVGGLVSGLGPALESRGGMWLGWSGGRHADSLDLAIDDSSRPVRASFDFRPEWHSRFYNGFANRSLWPLFHGCPGRARYDETEFKAYVEVNDVFAEQAAKLVARNGIVWAHDYHLLLVGAALRRLGHTGPIGHFTHIPFPPLDLFETIPWARELLAGMLEYDLVGFHTRRYASNFMRCAEELLTASPVERGVRWRGREVRVGAFPLGIDAAPFEDPDDDGSENEIAALQDALRGMKLVLGVDRLDYTKGIVERLLAFGRFLELYPEWRGQVVFVQVAVPSRADVPEYAEQRRTIETLVGRINGEHGEAHWVPVRYVYRSYGRSPLARLYRTAHVGFVTPLRDGMNLVSKEYIAAQDAADPGVLLLSSFAGAADELEGAILTNPHDHDGMARDLCRALAMPLAERIARHEPMLTSVRHNTPELWAAAFLDELERSNRS